MKIKWSDRDRLYITAGFITVIVGIVLCLFLINITYFKGMTTTFIGLIDPFIIGFVIAYILANPMKFVENRLLRFMDKFPVLSRRKRLVAVLITLLVAAVLVSSLISVVLPQLGDSISTLINNIPSGLRALEKMVEDLMVKHNLDSNSVEIFGIKWSEITAKATTILTTLAAGVLTVSRDITSKVMNFVIGVIISVYFLTSKESLFAQTKKIFFAFMPPKTVNKLIAIMGNANRIFNGFIGGKLLDSLIIGIICFVCTSLMKMPYALLISFIVGVTNIIPFFGPFIGAIPSTFIILIVDPWKALIFVIYVFLLQQFDGNILGPKILGDSTGLPAIWVMFAILVGGGLFGFVGMIVGVPTFAVIYSLIKEFVEYRLKKRSMPVDSGEYSDNERLKSMFDDQDI